MTPYYDDGTCVIYHGEALDHPDGRMAKLKRRDFPREENPK